MRVEGIRRLRTALAELFLADTDRMGTVRICTWNIREFGNSKYGGRDTYEPLFDMAEIISNFHIAAIQEVRDDMHEFTQFLRTLSRDWYYLAADVTVTDEPSALMVMALKNGL